MFKRGGRDISGHVFASHQSKSPKMYEAVINPAHIRVSAPSIPSKYLTPFIDKKVTE